MATYLILNIIFVLLVIILLRIPFKRPTKRILITLSVLLVLTAVFDSIIIGLGIVDYNADAILGITIGLAPVEDFFYAFFAIIIVPVLWNGLSLKKKVKHNAT